MSIFSLADNGRLECAVKHNPRNAGHGHQWECGIPGRGKQEVCTVVGTVREQQSEMHREQDNVRFVSSRFDRDWRWGVVLLSDCRVTTLFSRWFHGC